MLLIPAEHLECLHRVQACAWKVWNTLIMRAAHWSLLCPFIGWVTASLWSDWPGLGVRSATSPCTRARARTPPTSSASKTGPCPARAATWSWSSAGAGRRMSEEGLRLVDYIAALSLAEAWHLISLLSCGSRIMFIWSRAMGRDYEVSRLAEQRRLLIWSH